MGDPKWQKSAWTEIAEKQARPHPPVVSIGRVSALFLESLANVRTNKQTAKESVEDLARGLQQVFDEFHRR